MARFGASLGLPVLVVLKGSSDTDHLHLRTSTFQRSFRRGGHQFRHPPLLRRQGGIVVGAGGVKQ